MSVEFQVKESLSRHTLKVYQFVKSWNLCEIQSLNEISLKFYALGHVYNIKGSES